MNHLYPTRASYELLHSFFRKSYFTGKIILVFLLGMLLQKESAAQTSLAAGDLVFVGYNSSGVEDDFSFILLTPVSSGTSISFTDFGWRTDASAFQGYNTCGANTGASSDGAVTWTTGTALPAGTQVRIQCQTNLTASTGTVTGIQGAGGLPGQYMSLATGGESIFAFQGTLSSPVFISGLNMNGGWDATLTNCEFTSSKSALPAALSSHNLVKIPETDNAIYNCSTTSESPANLRAAVYNNNNWSGMDGTGVTYSLPLSCTFSASSCTAPVVTSNPPNRTVCADGNTTFGVTATGTGLSYKWQVNIGAGFTDITNGGIYSNAATKILSITGAPGTANGYQYRCVITGTCGNANSNAATLTVSSVSLNSYSQTNVSCNGGSNGAASVTPSGGISPYTYSWSPSGGTGATATGLAAMSYTVNVTDNIGCTASKNFTITQPAALSASSSTTPVSCNGGANGTATVTPSGGTGPYTYQWSGATGGQTSQTATGLAAGTYSCTITDANSCTKLVTGIVVNQPSALTAGVASSNVSCNGGSNGVAAVMPSGGNGGYTYLWTNGWTGQVTTGLAAGNISCTVTDSKGCTIKKDFTITQPSAFSITTSQTNITCNGGSNGSASVTVSGGTAPYAYSWSPSGGTAATATGLTAGTYTVTIEDFNGCQATRSFTISEPPGFTVTTSQTNVSCNGGSNGSAGVTVSGGAGPYSYSWSPSGGTGATATGLAAGNYTVTITDANTCQTTRSFTIKQPSAISISLVSQTNVSCNGGSNGAATVTSSGGTGAHTYAWYPSGGTAATATGLGAAYYSVVVTDANTCQTSQKVTIKEPDPLNAAITSQTNVSCNGGSNGKATVTVSGGTGSYTYSWSPSGGTAATATGLAAGTYTCTITDANSCQTTKSVSITAPAAFTVSTSQTNISCNSGSNGSAGVTVSGGTGSYSYSWSPSGGTGATATGLAAGNYTVTIEDANTCQTTRSFTITQPPAFTVTTSQTNVSCNGGSNGSAGVTVSGGTGSYTYSWSPSGGTGATATGLAAGNYKVTITDANDCQTTRSFTITQPPAFTITTSQTNVSCNSGSNGTATVSVSGGTGSYSYSWSPSGGTSATATGLAAGNYTVTITDANSCQTTRSFTITQPSALKIPITSQTNISCNGGSNGAATVNVSGGTGPYTYSWSPSGGTGATATGLAANMYTVTVTDANTCQTTKKFTITEPSAFNVTTSQTNVSCNGGSNGTASVSVSGGTGSYSYSWSPSGGTGATATGLVAGNYTVTITDANACQTTRSFTITQPVALSATATPTKQTICSGEQTNIALSSSPSGADFSWTVSNVSGNVSGASASGGAAIQQTLTGNGVVKYIVTPDNGICTGSPVSVSVTVNPLTVIEMHPSNKSVYDEESAKFSVEASNATAYQWQVNEGEGFADISNNSHYSGATTVTLTVSNITGSMNGYSYRCIASGNCAPVASNGALLSVKVRTAQTISFATTDEKVYGSPDFVPQAGSSAGLEVTFTSSDEAVAQVVDGKVHIKKAGQVTITASQPGNDDYKPAASATQTLTIAKRQVTVSLLATPLITKVYDGNTAATLVSENYSLENGVKGDDITVKGTAVYENSKAGTGKDITVKSFVLGGSDKDNYSLATTSAVVKGDISPKSIEVSILAAPAISKTYDGTNKAILQQQHYSISGVIGEDQVSIGESVALYADKKAGVEKEITVNAFVLAGADKDNYSLTTESTTASGDIIAKEITASFAQTPVISKTYNGNASASIPEQKYQLSGVEPGDDVLVSATAEYDNSNAGEDKTVTAGSFKLSGEDKDNYSLTTTVATTTGNIKKAIVKVILQSVPAVSKVYDGTTEASLQASNYTIDGIVGEDQVLANNPAVGTYDTKHGGTGKKVTVTGLELSGESAANYELSSTTASGNIGEITSRKIDVIAHEQTKQYGTNDPAFSYIADGILEGDGLAGNLLREEGKNVGSYTIAIGTLSGGDDYSIVNFTPAQLTITPAPLTIKADDKVKKQGAANPAFTFSYEGLAEGDVPADLETPATAATNASTGSPIGYYDIEVSGASSENYTITFAKGKLTVTPDEKYSLKVWSSSPDVLQVRIYSDVPQKAAIILYTETGQQVILQQKQLNTGVNTYSIYVGNMASSTYILGVAAEKFKQAEKVKVK